jgi:hypothetical protein
MRADRWLTALGFAVLGLCTILNGYMVLLVSRQVDKAQASLDKITTLVNHVITLH